VIDGVGVPVGLDPCVKEGVGLRDPVVVAVTVIVPVLEDDAVGVDVRLGVCVSDMDCVAVKELDLDGVPV
jgi:hypothetical protein